MAQDTMKARFKAASSHAREMMWLGSRSPYRIHLQGVPYPVLFWRDGLVELDCMKPRPGPDGNQMWRVLRRGRALPELREITHTLIEDFEGEDALDHETVPFEWVESALAHREWVEDEDFEPYVPYDPVWEREDA